MTIHLHMNVLFFYSLPSDLLQNFLFQLIASVAQNRNVNCILSLILHIGAVIWSYLFFHQPVFAICPFSYLSQSQDFSPGHSHLEPGLKNSFPTGYSASVLGSLLFILYSAMIADIFKCKLDLIILSRYLSCLPKIVPSKVSNIA